MLDTLINTVRPESPWVRLSTSRCQYNFRKEISPDTYDFIISTPPWDNKGETLRASERRIEKFTLSNGKNIVMKESRHDGTSLTENHFLASTTSLHYQVNIIDRAREKYLLTFGEQLQIETPFACVIDKKTTKRYFYYPFFESALENLDSDDERYREISDIGMAKSSAIQRNLKSIGFDTAEDHNYMIVKDDSPEGVGIVLIDTEFWKATEPAKEDVVQ